IASYIWRSLRPPIGFTVLNTFWMTLLALILATMFFHEGVICLLILSPLYFISILTGALIGRILFKTEPRRLQMSILPLLALTALAEPLARVDKESFVTDDIVI